MQPNSLTFRLVATSMLWVTGALLACGILLVMLFRAHIERRFDGQLRDHLEELVAASDIPETAILRLSWQPSDPRFNRPHSGWYWQVVHEDKVLARSRSLFNDRLATPASHRPGGEAGAQLAALSGPEGEALRGMIEAITLPDAAGEYLFTVAGPVHDISGDVDRFSRQLFIAFGLLALALIAAIPLQIRFGLQPLRTLQAAIAAVRAGERERLPADAPLEVQPVVGELNSLLDDNAALLEKARAQAANLAHALKNPLAVISNEAHEIEGEAGAILREQAAILGRHVTRHLARSRAAGARPRLHARTPVGAVIEDLRFSLLLLYKPRALQILTAGTEGAVFQGDAEDLEEMLGNLMDNACKWAARRIEISVTRTAPGRLAIAVDDDGPGIADELVDQLRGRGQRLDETVAGSGLGLDIAGEIAELNGGRLLLARSPLGGLRAALDLPAAG